MAEEKLGYKYYEKLNGKVPHVKIYLAHPFFNERQKELTAQAIEYLEQNDTVAVVHEPFQTQYKDVMIDNDPLGLFGSREWIQNTYQNDISALSSSDCGVFIYDMDKPDDGTAYELGAMRALHKPCIVIPFSEGPKKDYEMNLMIAAGATAFIDGNEHFEDLASYGFNHLPSDMTCPFPVF